MLKAKVRSLTAGASALAMVGLAAAGIAMAAGGTANASGGGGGPTPPWESSINAGMLLGGITFYNAQGQVVTGGSITSAGLGVYAVASTPDSVPGYSKATLFMYTPVNGVAPGQWSGEDFSPASIYPVSSAPAPIASTSQPVHTNSGTDESVLSYVETYPNTDTSATDGYAGLYDVRLRASGVGVPFQSAYWDAVISVDITQGTIQNPVAGTWSVDYPDYTQNTTTTLTTTPSSGSLQLSATVSPAAAGTVSFWANYDSCSPTQVGTAQTVTSTSGTASVTTPTPSSSTTYTAVYTPAIPDSATLASYDIGSTATETSPATPLVTTTTALAASPTGSAPQGSAVSLTATVTAGSSTIPAGSVNFEVNGTSIGTAAVSCTGVATLTTTTLLPSAPGGTSLTAAFTPSEPSYSSSTSTLSYTVDPVAVKPTIAGPHQAGQTETCSEGKLDPGVTVSYTWLANGKSIGTGSSLTVPGKAYNEKLACEASVSDGKGPVSSATSASVTVILGKALTPVKGKGPALSGSHAVGKTETVKPGTWSQSGATFTYQWLLNGKVIKGATKSTFKPTSSDNGKKLSCTVTAHLSGFANGSATTASVKVT